MTFDAAHTWPDGTPRSTNTAFTWRKEPEPVRQPTTHELRLEKQRIYERQRSAKKSALRVNREASLAAFVPSSTRAPR
jgi:hypothetical protein